MRQGRNAPCWLIALNQYAHKHTSTYSQRRRGCYLCRWRRGSGRGSNYKPVGFISTHLHPQHSLPYIAGRLAALENHGYNGGMGLGAPFQNNLLIPCGLGGKEKGVNLGVTGRDGHPDNESTPDTRQHPLSTTAKSPPEGWNQRCQQRESRKPAVSKSTLHHSQASSRDLQSGHRAPRSLPEVTCICQAQSSIFHRWWRLKM